MDNWIYLLKYASLPLKPFSVHLIASILIYISFNIYLTLILKTFLMHQTTSYNQQLKDKLKELEGT